MSQITICALYKFVRLDNVQKLQAPLLELMKQQQVRGTLLLAEEGINGTIAGPASSIEAVLQWLEADPRLTNIVNKRSFSEQQPFNRSRVKLKKEIVTMGIEGIDPNHVVGSYVKPSDWNQLIADPEVLVVDTRNDYEVQLGSFKHAVNPKTETFREFPAYVAEELDPQKHKKVAMFCTGGIRCEKSTAYLKEQGFAEVYHLEGGILKYLEEVPEQESLWEGDCFVFDERVTVDHQLQQGQYQLCSGCRMPISPSDLQSPKFEKGVSCPHCCDALTSEQKTRFREREKQVQLAKQRGEQHVGMEAAKHSEQRRQQKQQLRQAQRGKSAK
ncbi:oxygen-dependent tRNA uridine(34) hydroxylase TrhO [Agarivorans sp. MS3-6]|uniref:oxygen-dependent tRNA uridine(34) hydroxylase TrhO n=1 Tax=Agarivorans sp. TSD2052 TaxID=2937286 RepID=UPI00200F3659|nr:rhodanese-related sulfurtransferase [Agarivorans sp. TSD2052]UPW19704.1 rhodanese-related sulfurtransferase [Agarivorans sp. TSD2052]